MLSGKCRFFGLVVFDFSSNFFQKAFQTYICGFNLGHCFCRNPFLWRAIDFGSLSSRFRYFLWMLEFLLFLLLCFATCLLFCLLALCCSCFYAFLLLCLRAFLQPCVAWYFQWGQKYANHSHISCCPYMIWKLQPPVISRFLIIFIPTYMVICLLQV